MPLFLVPTPIGNREDITLRALAVLRQADAVACEDTRHTGQLLKHYSISARLLAYHEHNEREAAEGILALLREGKTVALVSDAGMPGISDPGGLLIPLVRAEGLPFTVLPGANAALCALLLSGFSARQFVFLGFLPTEKKERDILLASLQGEERTAILYEAPHRLLKTLSHLEPCLGERRVAFARELTKLYEECPVYTVEKALRVFSLAPPRGEFVLVIEGAANQPPALAEILQQLLSQGVPPKEAVTRAAKSAGRPKKEAYALLLQQQGKIDNTPENL